MSPNGKHRTTRTSVLNLVDRRERKEEDDTRARDGHRRYPTSLRVGCPRPLQETMLLPLSRYDQQHE